LTSSAIYYGNEAIRIAKPQSASKEASEAYQTMSKAYEKINPAEAIGI